MDAELSIERAFQNGLLVALDRDRAKQVFSAREPQRLQEVMQQLIADPELEQSGWRVSLSGYVEAIQQTLVRPGVGDPADVDGLAMTLLGGRPLPSEPSLAIRVVRPDAVPHLAAALERIQSADFVEHWQGEPEAPQAAQLLEAVAKLYAAAAEARAAVLTLATLESENQN